MTTFERTERPPLSDGIDDFYKPRALSMPWGVTDAGLASSGHRAVKMTVDVPSTY